MAEEPKLETAQTGIKLPDPEKLLVSSSPHLHDGNSIRRIMFLVVIALMPSCLMSIYFFGFNALRVLLICTLSCLVLEYVCGRLLKRPDAWKDGSAVVTGLLLGMVLSAGVPWWICVIGSILAIVLAKQLYGGLGYNPFNPALVARIGLTIGFPKLMTTWVPTRFMTDSDFLSAAGRQILEKQHLIGKTLPVTGSVIDGVTCATPLGVVGVTKEVGGGGSAEVFARLADAHHLWDYLIGNVGGCLGETSAIALLIGGVFLMVMKVIKWHIPVAYIGTVAVFSAIVHLAMGHAPLPGTLFQLFTGGLFIGAFFMATDMVTSPMTNAGGLIFGIGCGILTCVIRDWGSYPEGVMFSIVLMNALTPLIDRFTVKKPFGAPTAAALKTGGAAQ